MYKSLSFFLLFILLKIFVHFTISLAQTPGIWQCYGPSPEFVAIKKFKVNPLNPKRMYVLSSRSPFQSSDYGLNWISAQPPFDNGLTEIILVNNTLYASTSNGIFKSIDKGETWIATCSLFNDKFINNFIAVNDTLFVGTYKLYGGDPTIKNGVFRSIDGGVNWIQVLNDKSIESLVKSESTIYAITGRKFEEIYKSTDGGINWQPLIPPSISNDYSITNVISAHDTIFVGTTGNGLFRSTDGGMSWLNGNMNKYTPCSVKSILSIGRKIFVGCVLIEGGSRPVSYGLYESNDGGVNWTYILGEVDINTLSYLNGFLYVGTDKRSYGASNPSSESNGIYLSPDLGKTWIQANNPMDDKVVFDIIYAYGTLFAGTEENGIFRSFDNGRNWFAANNSNFIEIPNCTKLILNLNNIFTFSNFFTDGLFVSRDRGLEWSRVLDIPVVNMFLEKNSLFVETDLYYNVDKRDWEPPYIYRSFDWGITWNRSNRYYTVITFYSYNDKIYVGTADEGIYSTENYGEIWTPSNPPINNKKVNIIYAMNGKLYAGTDKNGVFRSEDEGINWNQANSPMNDKTVNCLISIDNKIFAGTDQDGVYWSIDNGLNWIQANSPMNNKNINVLSFEADTLYVGTSQDGIFLSTDKGLNWIQANSPMNNKNVTSLISIYNYLYTGTTTGVFRSIDQGINWTPLNYNMGEITINDLKFLHELDLLYAATEKGVYFQTIDVIPPIADSIKINLGASYTKKDTISLLLFAQGADSVIISEDSTFSVQISNWEVYNFTKEYLLSRADGLKTIYAVFKDNSYNYSDTIKADIILDTTPPSSPDSLSSQIVPNLPSKRYLFWQKSTDNTSGVEKYRVYLCQNKEFLGPTTLKDSVLASEKPIYTTPSLADTTWYWNVTAIDRAGNKAISQIDSFTINVGKAPVAPLIQLPINIINDNTPTISWTKIEEAETYRLEYSMPSNENFKIADLIQPSYTFTQALSDGNYWFWVFAINASGIESVASPKAQLIIDTQPPISPTVNTTNEFYFVKSVTIKLRLSANEADSLRILGDHTNNELKKFNRFDIENPTHTEVEINLTQGDGLKNLQAQYKDRAGNIANAFKSIFLDTQKPIFISNTPQLSEETPIIQEAVTVSLSSPTDREGSGIKSFELFYRKGGDDWDDQNKTSFRNNLAEIPSAFVTNQGVDFQIIAEDSAGNQSILPNENLTFFSVPVTISSEEAGSTEGLPGGTGGAAYRLVSLPLTVDNRSASEAFTNLGSYGAENDYRFWQYDGGDSWHEGTNIIIQPGESYFLLKRKSGNLSNKSSGKTAKATDAALGNIVGWRLRAKDWTLIGNLFNFEISLTDLWLQKRDTSLVFVTDIWSYDGGSQHNGWTKRNLNLLPWKGLAVYNDGAEDVIVYHSTSSNASLPKTQFVDLYKIQNKVSHTEISNDNEWILQVHAESRGYQDNENYFGVLKQAKIGKDAFDYYEPPLLPDGVSLSFINQDGKIQRSLASDIRPFDEKGNQWTMQIKGMGGSSVKLRFDKLESMSSELEIYILDQGNRILRDLRQQPEIEVYLPQSTNTRILNILVGDRSFVKEHAQGLSLIPETFTLYQNYPNPFNKSTVIRYSLPVSGKVTLKVYDLMGKEVMTLIKEQNQHPGYYENVIDLYDFASGIYIYRVLVSGEQRFEATKKMIFVK